MEFVLTHKKKKVGKKRNDFHHKSFQGLEQEMGPGLNGPPVPPASLPLSFKVNLSSSESPPALSLSITWSILEDPQTHNFAVWTRWDED